MRIINEMTCSHAVWRRLLLSQHSCYRSELTHRLRRRFGALQKVVIWLILPVVICLSQRLSHACVSISIVQRNCEWLIKTVIVYLILESYMDNRGNSTANTCFKTRLFGRVVFIRYKTIPSGLWWIIITDRIEACLDKSFKFLPYQL